MEFGITSSKVTGKDSGLDLRCTCILGEVDLVDMITLLINIFLSF